MNLKKNLSNKIPGWRNEITELIGQHGETLVSGITIHQMFKGLRGVPSLVCDTSYVDPHQGLFIRDYPLLEIQDKLPEEIFYLLCTGELPGSKALKSLQKDLKERMFVPSYVWELVRHLSDDTHPMVILSMVMLALQKESIFSREYAGGLPKDKHWEATLEDALDIVAKMPIIAAGIFRLKVLKKDIIPPNPQLDLAGNFGYMLGVRELDEMFVDFLRLFMVVHSDHEGGNVAVNTTRIVNSALSDLYYSISAGINGLAGFLHGMANQEMVNYVLTLIDQYGGVPQENEIRDFVRNILNSGKIFPGFGHAVLRDKDPRFTAMYDFGKKNWPGEMTFQVVEKLSKIVPPLLIEQGKAKNPYPNIDAISGVMLYHFGIKETGFYPVMFATAQVLGICAQLVINRAILSPIFRPRSVTTKWLKELAEKEAGE